MRRTTILLLAAIAVICSASTSRAETYFTAGGGRLSLVSSNKLLVFDQGLVSLSGSDLCPGSETGLIGGGGPFLCPIDDDHGLVFAADTNSPGVVLGLIDANRSVTYDGADVAAALEGAGMVSALGEATLEGHSWVDAAGATYVDVGGIFYFASGTPPCAGWTEGGTATCGADNAPQVFLDSYGTVYASNSSGEVSVVTALGLTQLGNPSYVQPIGINPDPSKVQVPQNQVHCTALSIDTAHHVACATCTGTYEGSTHYNLTCVNACAWDLAQAAIACNNAYLLNHNRPTQTACNTTARHNWIVCREGCSSPQPITLTARVCVPI